MIKYFFIPVFLFFLQEGMTQETTPLNSLGSAYEAAGKIGLAIENYQKSLAINGADERIQNRLERLMNN